MVGLGSTTGMPPTPASIQRIYLTLLLGNTLAASFIWGINTIFLLDAGLSNLEAFAANAFFTAGMVIFEVPTGIVADTRGRRYSYLLGTIALRSEEHTSELQSPCNLVCRLLLEKKKKKKIR